MSKHKVLIIGSGGREHALAWSLARSRHVEHVYVASGNGGTQWLASGNATGLMPTASCENVAIVETDFPALIAFAQANQIALTVVGPEIPLVAGIVDKFSEASLAIFGPSQQAAQLEGSKAFSKDFMRNVGIPTAEYGVFTSMAEAQAFLHNFGRPVVVKASGLAAGKGVIVCDTSEEANAALEQIMAQKAFGTAGDEVIIEERLAGDEISVLAFCDGKSVVPMKIARDHKRALAGDMGLNTGGMGAFAPITDISDHQLDNIIRTVLQPTVDAMAAKGIPYVGVLYAGLMLTPNGVKVLEFNCRFGDPETQVILPLLKTDIFEILMACVEGRLDQIAIDWHDNSCATVVLASPGYPEVYPKGLLINGPSATDPLPENVIVFHAGTKIQGGQLVTSGGRVMAVTAIGDTLSDALDRAYKAVESIHFDGMHYRRDIGQKVQEV